jgi:type IV pilus assembly protein PilY1
MIQSISLLRAFAVALLLAASGTAFALFEPSNDDTDLFLVSPGVNLQRPNVLILLDNTANWNTPFTNEMTAIAGAVDAVSKQFNLGLMMFVETGAPNDNIDGADVRFAVRPMEDPNNRAALSSLVRSLSKNTDKGNNATFALAMYEAYAYFGGLNARSGFGKAKRDYPSNAANPIAGARPGPAFANVSSQTYISPITEACQKNVIIIISNGPASENTASLAAAQSKLQLMMNVAPPPTIPIPVDSGEQNNWTDEYARFMANGDCNVNFKNSSVYTFAIEVDPGTVSAARAHTALLKSAAQNGKGEYLVVDSQRDGGVQIKEALDKILSGMLATSSVFASATLPVSVNVRGTNANQVYMGVFRPDANKNPRWFGNLKMYKIGLKNKVDLFLADADGLEAEDQKEGFIKPAARSFWTTSSSFWAYRTPFETTDIGKQSDSPDGNLVEKGAAAQHIRAKLPGDRALYTCTTPPAPATTGCNPGSSAGTSYTPGSALSNTLFSTANADITAAALGVADATRRTEIIDWVRGKDLDNEDLDAATDTGRFNDMRASVHGDVLHSRPAVINYNRSGSNDDNDVFVFYGANDGVFHALKGGTATGAGEEAWGFVASEHFGQLKRLRENTALIGAAAKKPAFFDGPIGVYTHDVNGDGRLVQSDGDTVLLFLTTRRGGRQIYALDVSDPLVPRFLWKRGCPNLTDNIGCDSGFAELGQTWSEPKVTFMRAFGAKPVLVFGAGYDAAVEDIQPCLVSAMTATSVTTTIGGTVTYTLGGSCTVAGGAAATVSRSMGRGLFVVDAYNGNVLWRAGADALATAMVSGMSFSVAGDVAVLNRDRDGSRTIVGTENVPGGYADRIYATDTGGNVWRIDVNSALPAEWVVTKLASIADLASPGGRRKFMASPDVVYTRDGPYDAVLIGSGDREHPFDTTVENRFYAFKDKKTGLDASGQMTVAEAAMYDATSNCLQECTGTDLTAAQAANTAGSGWYIRLRAGEKVLGAPATVSGTVFFNTNQPAPSACTGALGIAREYMVGYKDGSAAFDLTVGGGLTTADRSAEHAGGGYLPQPVPVLVRIDGEEYQGVVSGTSIREPNPLPLRARLRTYWFRKID